MGAARHYLSTYIPSVCQLLEGWHREANFYRVQLQYGDFQVT